MKQAIVWLATGLVCNDGVVAKVLVGDVERIDENQRSATLKLQGGGTIVAQYTTAIFADNVSDYTWIVDQTEGYVDLRLAAPEEAPAAE